MSKVPDPLWGVDDEKVAQHLRERALKAAPKSQSRNAYLFGMLAFTIATIPLVELTFYGRLPGWARLTMLLAFIWLWTERIRRRAERKELPTILKSEGRCTHCGYKLDAPGGLQCPECGTASGNGRPV